MGTPLFFEHVVGFFGAKPDFGAHRRFFRMVRSGGCTWNDQVPLAEDLLPLEQILFLEKTRVGEKSETTSALKWMDDDGVGHEARPIARGAHVIIADDFTNSGGTLAPQIGRAHV